MDVDFTAGDVKRAIRGIMAKVMRAARRGAGRRGNCQPEAGGTFKLVYMPFTGAGAGICADPGSPDIKAKFGIGEGGKEGVTAALTVLGAYIKAGGLSMPENVVRPGDYIDLEGGLEVETYKGEGYFKERDRELGPGRRMLRLVVAGINSFHPGRGTKATGGTTVNGEASGRYGGMGNEGVPHVVLHFQNIPVLRRMNAEGSNAGGYAASEMRRYLVDVDGDGTGGAFLAGLRAAGVPAAAMWAPARYVSGADGGGAALRDLVWLPTERELFSRGPGGLLGAGDETAGNQARLEYYLNMESRRKANREGGMHYWTASPGRNGTLFCIVNDCGMRMAADANMELGCAPAFCIR